MQTADIFGVKIAHLTFHEAVSAALGMVSCDVPSMIITLNPEMIQQIQHDKELAAVIHSADLVVADGVGVVWATRMMGCPVPERVTGTDLMLNIIRRGAADGLRVYLLGGKPGVAEKAGQVLEARHPGLVISGTMHGYFGPGENDKVIREVRQARPDVLFVGMGVGRQEKWIYRHKETLGVSLSIGVGGSLDVVAGVVPRAPNWAQRANIEWLYRLINEPSRWRRQLALPAFALRVLRESKRGKNRG